MSPSVFKKLVYPSVKEIIEGGWEQATPETLLIALALQRLWGVCMHEILFLAHCQSMRLGTGALKVGSVSQSRACRVKFFFSRHSWYCAWFILWPQFISRIINSFHCHCNSPNPSLTQDTSMIRPQLYPCQLLKVKGKVTLCNVGSSICSVAGINGS